MEVLTMKICKKCLKDKEDSDFYTSNKSKCKECVKNASTSYRNKNIDKVRAYDRARGSRQPPEYLKKYRDMYPNKYKAHNMVNNAVRDKRLFPKEDCENCGSIMRIEGHHDDYLKPLNVRWLCSCCHKQWHRDNGEGLNP